MSSRRGREGDSFKAMLGEVSVVVKGESELDVLFKRWWSNFLTAALVSSFAVAYAQSFVFHLHVMEGRSWMRFDDEITLWNATRRRK